MNKSTIKRLQETINKWNRSEIDVAEFMESFQYGKVCAGLYYLRSLNTGNIYYVSKTDREFGGYWTFYLSSCIPDEMLDTKNLAIASLIVHIVDVGKLKQKQFNATIDHIIKCEKFLVPFCGYSWEEYQAIKNKNLRPIGEYASRAEYFRDALANLEAHIEAYHYQASVCYAKTGDYC